MTSRPPGFDETARHRLRDEIRRPDVEGEDRIEVVFESFRAVAAGVVDQDVERAVGVDQGAHGGDIRTCAIAASMSATASSPRRSISARMASTVVRTFWSASARSAAPVAVSRCCAFCPPRSLWKPDRQPMSEASRPRVNCEMVTARISAPPLKILVTHSGMPSIERPVMPVARK